MGWSMSLSSSRRSSSSSDRTRVGLPDIEMSLPGCSLSLLISSAKLSPIRVEFSHSRGSSRVVETTYFLTPFICAATGFSSGSCFGQNAAHSSQRTRPMSMASEAAIAAPIASPIWSLKYGKCHFSGDSTTPSSDTNSDATTFLIRTSCESMFQPNIRQAKYPLVVPLRVGLEPGKVGHLWPDRGQAFVGLAAQHHRVGCLPHLKRGLLAVGVENEPPVWLGHRCFEGAVDGDGVVDDQSSHEKLLSIRSRS